jgi:hypothetical protein
MAVVYYARYKYFNRFASGTVTCDTGVIATVSPLKPPCGGYRSKTAAWIHKWFKIFVGAFKKL